MKILFIEFLQIILFVFLAPLLAGWIKLLKCYLQNRRAPSLFQPYLNLMKLFHKQTLLPETASWIFTFSPYLIFTIMVLASGIVPLFMINLFSAHFAIGDIIVLIGLFSLGRFFLALAGMDVGTAFGGMGSSREMMIAALAEPATLLVLFTLAMTASSTNLSSIVSYLVNSSFIFRPSFIFSLLGLSIITLAETGRIPVDNPATHLELTMVHEAMILEYSGRYLAFIEWASQIKLMIYCVLISNIFFPWGIATQLTPMALAKGIGVILLKLFICGGVLATTEISLAKMRLFKVPYFLSIAFLFCLLGILSHIILEIN